MKVLFHLKDGQKKKLLLNLIFPYYPIGYDEQSVKEKEADKSASFSGCSHTPHLVSEILPQLNQFLTVLLVS